MQPCLGWLREGVAPLPLRGSGGVTPGNFFWIFDSKSRVRGQFGPENKLIEGQANEYDVICRNASVLAFTCGQRYLPERRSGNKIFAGTAFPHHYTLSITLICSRFVVQQVARFRLAQGVSQSVCGSRACLLCGGSMHIWGEIWRPPHRISLVVGVDVDPKK